MTFRLRLLIIVAVSFASSLAIIALSLNKSAQMRRTARQLSAVDLSRLQMRADMRDALHRVRAARDRFGARAASAFEVEVERQLDTFQQTLDASKRFLPASGHGSYDELRKLSSRLRELSDSVVELGTLQTRQVGLLSGPLKMESERLRNRLEELYEDDTSSLGSLGPAMTERLKAQSTALFETFDFLRTADERSLEVWRETLKLQQNQLRSVFLYLRGASEEPHQQARIAKLAEQTDRFVRSLVDLVSRRSNFESSENELMTDYHEALEQLWVGIDALVTELPRDVQSRQRELSNLAEALFSELGGAFIAGSVVVAALVIFLVAGIERDVNKLKSVASAIEGGDLKVEAIFERSVEELAELGRAFNKLAQSLSAVRETQTYRDRIVTGLNRSVRLADILRISVGELVRATRSKTGCVYLKVMGRDELLLAETYALPRGASAPEILRVGESLVGQVARDRKTMVLSEVPAQSLKIVSATLEADVGAVIIVPILFKDELLGVIEMASLGGYSAETVHFVEEVVFQIAVAINNAGAVETIRTTASALERKTEELEHLNSELERANMLKSEFLATMSHELRTPLGSIIGFSDLILETDSGLSASARENLAKVVRNAEHLLALINDILDLSKVEAGGMEVHWHEVALPALVHELTTDIQPMADSKKVGLHCEIEHGVPPAVMLDLDKVRRIVQNLLANAVKFTEQGAVRVRVYRGDDRILIEVKDTGIGIPADQLPVIFEKFRQVDGSRSRRFGGTGLGLAITKELCHRMEGSIRVSSREGKGSTFTVNLPLRLPDDLGAAPSIEIAAEIGPGASS